MAEHNLFLGGGRPNNGDFAMYPAKAVSASEALDVATHKGAQFTWLNRVIDPTKDVALKEYLRANPSADDALEVWNVGVIPAGSIVIGHQYRVVSPVTGLTFTTRLKNIQSAATTNISAGVDGGVADATAYVNSGAGLVGQMAYNQYLQFVLAAVPVGGIMDMRIEVASLIVTPFRGEW